MSVAIANNDLLSCRVWTTFGTQAAVNTYNYQAFAVTGGGITDSDLAAAFDLLVATTYQGIMTTATVYNGVQVYFRQRGTSYLPAPVKYTASAGPGLQAVLTLPSQLAAVMRYSTVIRGPGGRGRVYLPFIAENEVAADGNQDTSLITAINAMATLLLPPITITSGGSSASFAWSILHRLPGPTVLYSADSIISAESSGKFGQMHKRGAYGRVNASPI